MASDDGRHRIVVADLGCGAGNLALPLTWWLQQQQHDQQKGNALFSVLGVDLNGFALQRLRDRASRVMTANTNGGKMIETLQQDLLDLVEGTTTRDDDDATKDIGSCSLQLSDCAAVVSLHACGAASDLSIAAAVKHGLPFAISPCCIGKVMTSRSGVGIGGGGGATHHSMPQASSTNRSAAPKGTISYPRSDWLREKITEEDYQLLAAAADYGGTSSLAGDDPNESVRWQRSRKAKLIVETDRLQWAQELGYYVRILELPRIGAFYSKRELLLGAVRDSPAAHRIAELPTVSNCDQ